MFASQGSLTLTQRLFVLTAVALAPAFLILIYNLVTLRQSRMEEVHAIALRTAQIASLEMDRIIFGSEDVLRAIAAAPVVSLTGPGCSAYLRALDRQLPKFAVIRVLDPGGDVVCTSETIVRATHFGDREYVRAATETGTFVVGRYVEDRADGTRVLPLALPVRDEAGQLVRIAVATLDLGWLGNRIRERDFPARNALTIADHDGTIIAREPFPEQFGGTKIPEAFMRLVHAPEPGSEEVTSQDGTVRIIGFMPATRTPQGLYVSAGIASEEMFRPIRDATLRGLAMAVAGLALAVLFASWTGRVLVQAPMARLLSTITAWRSGNETVRSGMTERQGELGMVGSAIDSYMDRLIEDRNARRLAEEHRELLLRELDHRVKNILATVQAIARQTFRDGTDPQEATDVFGARLGAIASAHALLTSNAWQSTNITEVVATAIRPFRSEGGGNFTVSGPSLVICAKVALALSMALHELSTNSVKYGALSRDSGGVTIRWTVIGPAEDRRLRFEWIETGGPPVVAPTRRGFGSKMIERLLAAEIDGTIDLSFPATGVTCIIDAPLATISAMDSPTAPAPAPAAGSFAATGSPVSPAGETGGGGVVSPSSAREISSAP